MKFKLIKLWKEDVGYGSDKRSVLIWELKNENGNKYTFRSATLQPRFYLPRDTMLYDLEGIVGTEQVPMTHLLTGQSMNRVYTQLTSHVGSIRKEYKPEDKKVSLACQADILFPQVALTESEIYEGVEIDDDLLDMDSLPFEEFKPCESPDVDPSTCYLDIECQHPPNVLPNAKKEKDIIYLIGVRQEGELKQFWLDNKYPIPTHTEFQQYCIETGFPDYDYSKEYIEVFQTEEELLKAFLDYFESLDPDIMTGWNVIFDSDYIMGRCKRYRLGNRWWHLIRKLNIHDSMECYKRLYRAPSNRLKDVLVHEGIVKEDEMIDDKHDVMWWREGQNIRALTYNAYYDVICLEKLDLKKSLMEYDWGVKKLAGFPDLHPTNYRMSVVTALCHRVAKDEFILPSKPEWDRHAKKEKKKGAIVFQPDVGHKNNVAVLDFSMYYPIIIIAHNLSKEIPIGQLSPKGIIPKATEHLIKHRLAAKAEKARCIEKYGPDSPEAKKAKRLDDVSKFGLNSVFGVQGNPSFILYDKDRFEEITKHGREGLLDIKSIAENRGFKVVYGDTDSVFIQFDNYEQAEAFAEEINQLLNGMYREKYGLTVDFDIKVEKWLNPVVFSKKRDDDEAGKKRYFYRVVYEDGINLEEIGQDYVVVMGHEMVKRTASPLCKFVQKKVFEDIAYGRIDEVTPFLRECYDSYMNGDFDLDSVAARMTITMRFEDYKSPTVAARGAMFLNEHMNPSEPINVGDTVRYLYVKSVDGRRSTDVISFNSYKDVEGRIEVDWEKMFEKQIINKTEDVLEDVDIYWEQVLGQTDITAFF